MSEEATGLHCSLLGGVVGVSPTPCEKGAAAMPYAIFFRVACVANMVTFSDDVPRRLVAIAGKICKGTVCGSFGSKS